MIYFFWVEGHPNTNHRPRKGKGGFHMDPHYTAWKEAVGWAAKAAGVQPLQGRVAVYAFVCSKSWLSQDSDNQVKGILDGLEGVAYENDRQVLRLVAESLPPDPERGEGTLVVLVGESPSPR